MGSFIKWTGGKNKLASYISSKFPSYIDYYFEPFLGAGSVFFELVKKRTIMNAFLSDSNKFLINTFLVVQTNPTRLIFELEKMSREYNSVVDKKSYFESVRSNFNHLISTISASDLSVGNVELASIFIFLNKTCFNGLYRVNKKGVFNSPFGKYSNPPILDSDLIMRCHYDLQNVYIQHRNYVDAIEKCLKCNDAYPTSKICVYLDPPYYPSNKTSFVSYTSNQFSVSDHEELSNYFHLMKKNNCFVLMTNSYADEIFELYKEDNLEKVVANRSAGGGASSRKKVADLIIT